MPGRRCSAPICRSSATGRPTPCRSPRKSSTTRSWSRCSTTCSVWARSSVGRSSSGRPVRRCAGGCGRGTPAPRCSP
ncbi:hypothetical protein [Ornithinimicrobium kibberense]|uniref:hypothetical protein n=1 Tax=Ornithinimicrobium kibberense TaxID=282060 RepID=UPI003618F101